jgi:hypothetical protein
MARQQIAKKNIHEDSSGVTIDFSDGEALTVNLSELPEEMITHLALHGLSQKLGDSYSGESDITVARTKAAGVAERLNKGDWKAVREGGGSKITDLAHALATVTGKTVEESVTVISNMEAADKKGLRNHPKIAAELAKITAARAQAKAEKAAESDDNEFDLSTL